MGLAGINFAPKGVTVKKFFEEFVPGEFGKFKAMAALLPDDIKFGLGVRVQGVADYTCALNKDGLTVTPGLKDDADVTISLQEKDFLAVVTGERKMMMEPPGGGGGNKPSPDKIPQMMRDNLAVLRQVQGVLEYKLEDKADGDFVVKVKFQGPMKEDADVSVTMDRADAEAMGRGELDPQAAFMAGRVQISGDMTILMQLMPIMMNR